MRMGNILIVEDEKRQRDILKVILQSEGYGVEAVGNGAESLRHVKDSLSLNHPFDLIITDLRLPDIDGLNLLEELLTIDPNLCAIVITAYGSIESAVEAMKKGAFDYLTKPFDKEQLLLAIKRAFGKIKLQKENRYLYHQLETRYTLEGIVGSHGLMQEVFKTVKKIAPSDSTVLISGESGTGKELVAKAIHYNSLRKSRPFVAINCAALPETLLESELFGYEKGAFTGAEQRKIGLFEVADKSTLFLDEIGDLTLPMQAKLLRALQERTIRRLGGREEIKIDVRVIAATNRDLNELMKQGKFREDLYWRFNVITIQLPPLRERPTDIPELIEYFVTKFADQKSKRINGVSHEALSLLMAYDWPGNIRQLESVIERAILLMEGDTIQVGDLSPEVKTGNSKTIHSSIQIPEEGISFSEVEKNLIYQAMEKSDWVISKAAKLLGMSYRTLQYRLEKFQLRRNN